MYRSPHATARLVALVSTLIPVLFLLFVTSALAGRGDEPVILEQPSAGQLLPTSQLVANSTQRKFAVEARTPNQTMEMAELVLTLPEPGRGSVVGIVADDDRHLVAFSRSFSSGQVSSAEVPVTLSKAALVTIRQRGFLRVELRTKFMPTSSGAVQKYKSDLKLRPFAVTDSATDTQSQIATATLRTPRTGRLAVKFHLRDRATDRSVKLKSFDAREIPGGSYTFAAPLTDAARRAIIIGKVKLMVTARFEPAHFSTRMLRSKLIRCRTCGVGLR